jgi:hypothetical protein
MFDLCGAFVVSQSFVISNLLLPLQMLSIDDDDADAADVAGGAPDQGAAAAGVYVTAAQKGVVGGLEGAGDGGVVLGMPPMPNLT